jgi:CDP-glycerol glycerophosphotransferase (TagB/SpsB family)
MLRHCDVLLTEYSTLMIEGAIFDRPIVNVALYNFRDTDRPAAYLENYTHIKRMLATGASRNAYTFEELLRYVREYLEDPTREAQGRRALVDQEVAVNRGCAGRRVAELLEALAQRR